MKIEKYDFLKKEVEKNYVHLASKLFYYHLYKGGKPELSLLESVEAWKHILPLRQKYTLFHESVYEFMAEDGREYSMFIHQAENGKLVQEGKISEFLNFSFKDLIGPDGENIKPKTIQVDVLQLSMIGLGVIINIKYGDIFKSESPLHYRFELWFNNISQQIHSLKCDNTKDPVNKDRTLAGFSFRVAETSPPFVASLSPSMTIFTPKFPGLPEYHLEHLNDLWYGDYPFNTQL